MDQIDYEALFQQVYANLPLSARKEIIVVLDGEPMTWKAAKVEVDNNTAIGEKVLQQLAELKLLSDEENNTK